VSFPSLSVPQLLDLLAKVQPESYADPIVEADAAGEDTRQMQAVQFSAEDAANLANAQAYYLKPHSDQLGEPAAGATIATGTVQMSRLGTAEGPATVVQGTVLEGLVTNSIGETVSAGFFVTLSDTDFAVGEAGPVSVPIGGAVTGYWGNLPAASISRFQPAADGDMTATVIDSVTLQDEGPFSGAARFNELLVDRFIVFQSSAPDMFPRRIEAVNVGSGTDPATATLAVALPAGAPSSVPISVVTFDDLFAVEQLQATSGGGIAMLDAIGDERRLYRQVDETDDAFRSRICNLPDVVSPNAIVRICQRILGPLGCPFLFVETLGPGLLGFTYDTDLPMSAYDLGTFPGNGYVYAPPVRYFAIIVGPCSVEQLGAPYDADNAPRPNAYDFEMMYDGEDFALAGVLDSLYSQVEAARAAGVAWELLFDPNL